MSGTPGTSKMHVLVLASVIGCVMMAAVVAGGEAVSRSRGAGITTSFSDATECAVCEQMVYEITTTLWDTTGIAKRTIEIGSSLNDRAHYAKINYASSETRIIEILEDTCKPLSEGTWANAFTYTRPKLVKAPKDTEDVSDWLKTRNATRLTGKALKRTRKDVENLCYALLGEYDEPLTLALYRESESLKQETRAAVSEALCDQLMGVCDVSEAALEASAAWEAAAAASHRVWLLARLEADIAAETARAEAARARHASLEAETVAAEAAVAAAETSEAELRAAAVVPAPPVPAQELARAESAVTDAETDAAEQRSVLEAAQETLTAVRATEKAASQGWRDALRASQHATANVERKRAALLRAQNALDDAKRQQSRTQNALAEAEARSRSANATLAEAQTAQSAAQRAVDDAEVVLAERQSALDALTTSPEEKREAEIDAAVAAVAEARERLEGVRRKQGKAEADVADAEDKVKEAQEAIDALAALPLGDGSTPNPKTKDEL